MNKTRRMIKMNKKNKKNKKMKNKKMNRIIDYHFNFPITN
jgi:hypothetical protein